MYDRICAFSMEAFEEVSLLTIQKPAPSQLTVPSLETAENVNVCLLWNARRKRFGRFFRTVLYSTRRCSLYWANLLSKCCEYSTVIQPNTMRSAAPLVARRYTYHLGDFILSSSNLNKY